MSLTRDKVGPCPLRDLIDCYDIGFAPIYIQRKHGGGEAIAPPFPTVLSKKHKGFERKGPHAPKEC
jgi:hypothetical protein